MSHLCPICKKTVIGDTKFYIKHTEDHIVNLVRSERPDWRKFEEYLLNIMKSLEV